MFFVMKALNCCHPASRHRLLSDHNIPITLHRTLIKYTLGPMIVDVYEFMVMKLVALSGRRIKRVSLGQLGPWLEATQARKFSFLFSPNIS